MITKNTIGFVFFVSFVVLTYFDQTKLLFPLLLHELQQVPSQTAFRNDAARLTMRILHDIAVSHEIARPQSWKTRLPRAEEVARSAQFEIALGDHKAVGGRSHGFEPLTRLVGPRRLIQQHAV